VLHPPLGHILSLPSTLHSHPLHFLQLFHLVGSEWPSMPGHAKSQTLKSREETAASEKLILRAIDIYKASQKSDSPKKIGYRKAAKQVEQETFLKTKKWVSVNHNTVRNHKKIPQLPKTWTKSWQEKNSQTLEGPQEASCNGGETSSDDEDE
jgi:hypothetical protein